MTLNLRMVLQADSGAAKAALEDTARGIKSVTAATTEQASKSKAAATAADTEAAAKRRNAQASREMVASNRQAAGATGQLVAQLNDVGMMLAAGQNPLMLAVQQGSQITQVIGPMGAAGAAKALGSALMGLLSPMNLVTLGAIYAGGVMVQWLTGAEEDARLLEDQIEAVTQAVSAWREESGKSLADLRKDFGTITPELVEMQRELNQLRIVDIMKEAQLAAQGLAETMNGGFYGQASNIKDLLGLDQFSRQGNVGNALVQEIQGLLDAVGNASGVKEQLAAVEQLRVRFSEVTGGVNSMNAEQRAFYQTVLESEAALRMAAVATGEVASGTEDAGRAASELATRAQSVVSTIASADGSRLVAAFSAAFPMASQLLGMARGIVDTIGGLELPAPGVGMGRGMSPGGPLIGSPDLAALQAAGGVWRVAPTKLPGGGGGGGAAAARDEADALQELIDSLNGEIEALRVQDPIQKEMLQHRKALEGATEAERQKIEDLISTREREKAQLEQIEELEKFRNDLIDNALEALIVKGESLQDVLKGVIAALAKAAIQAAIFGQGPLGSIFGGVGIGELLFGGGKAAGGMVYGPGTATSDSILTPLSNGEYVVNAQATARNRHLLEAINAGGSVRGFAEGGYVGSDNRRAGARAEGGNPTFNINLAGARGDREIEEAAHRGMRRALEEYDRDSLPGSVKRISRDQKRVG